MSTFQSAAVRLSVALFVAGLLLAAVGAMLWSSTERAGAQPLPGAIWTTDPAGNAVNENHFTNKCDVSLNGGPHVEQAHHLPDGSYDVAVTDPSGSAILGQGSGTVTITGGQGTFGPTSLCALVSPSPYLDTPNPGGVYWVWLCVAGQLFVQANCKTDTFKVTEVIVTPTPTPVVTPTPTPVVIPETPTPTPEVPTPTPTPTPEVPTPTPTPEVPTPTPEVIVVVPTPAPVDVITVVPPPVVVPPAAVAPVVEAPAVFPVTGDGSQPGTSSSLALVLVVAGGLALASSGAGLAYAGMKRRR